uniref:CUB and zona pellucida like domains 1 n=1 Tax=Terrapene triunguis TaxID=2587831 RepID=A0A674K0C7_9SAUR
MYSCDHAETDVEECRINVWSRTLPLVWGVWCIWRRAKLQANCLKGAARDFPAQLNIFTGNKTKRNSKIYWFLFLLAINGSCGGYLSTASGSFSSPFFPGNYPMNVKCIWRIEVKNNYYIRLIFKHLELEFSYNCAYDFVEVYDGPLNTSPLLGRICDGSNYTFTSSSNTMTVLFSSDFSYTRSGFSAYYDSFPEKNNDTALSCSGQYMRAVINRTYLQSLGYNAWDVYLNDSSCGPQQITETYVIFNIPFNGCGTIRQVKNNTITYSNVIRTSPSGYIITRENDFQFHITCKMNQDTMVEIMYVAKGAIDIRETQHGRYDVNISFYESSNFSNPDLFLQATLYSSDSNLVMFADTCTFYLKLYVYLSFCFYCLCVRDSTYSSYYSPMGYVVRFKFNAFKFLNRHAAIYLQCKIVVCRAYDYSSRCYQGCLVRRKRDTSPYQEKIDVVVGPVQRKKETNEDRKSGNLFLWPFLLLYLLSIILQYHCGEKELGGLLYGSQSNTEGPSSGPLTEADYTDGLYIEQYRPGPEQN